MPIRLKNHKQRIDRSGSRITFRSGEEPKIFNVDVDGEEYEATCESIGTLPQAQEGLEEDEFVF